MTTPDSKREIAKARMAALSSIRCFFVERGFIEIEAPILVKSPDMEPTLTPFETVIERPGEDSLKAALITSPEYSMKKLLAHGFEKIFSLGPVFRNGEAWDETHASEFTMLEWYESGSDYKAGMQQTEDLVKAVAKSLEVESRVLLGEWKRVSMQDLFFEVLGIKDIGALTLKELRHEVNTRDMHTVSDDTWSDLFYRLFVTLVEPSLPNGQVTILHDYPLPQAALAKECSDGLYAERFEVYVGKLELCNAFTELTDANEQRKRFEQELAERKRLGKTIFPIDEELLRLLPSLRNPTFGNALGFDRLMMSLLKRQSIDEVLLFPPFSPAKPDPASPDIL